MHSGWNTWSHLGIKRSVSVSSNSHKHTAHSSVPFPSLWILTTEYSSVGNASITAGSRPRDPRRERPAPPARGVSAVADVDGEEAHEEERGDEDDDYDGHGGAEAVVIRIVLVIVPGLCCGEGEDEEE
ncbi:hypothetical protein CR513_09916, partial [Mucuna pruriens]